MNRTRIKMGLPTVPTLPLSVSQVLVDEYGAYNIIRLIEDGMDFSQANAPMFTRRDMVVT